jgi:hypothetical protein
MRAVDPRIALAVRNNAEWCDTVTRSWGGHGRFEPEVWINPGEAPPFYPNAVTLMPTVHVPATIGEADGDFAVKDSFAVLDLAPLGYAPLFDAHWIWRDPLPPVKSIAAVWRIVRDAEPLARWEVAWRDGEPPLDLFRPLLLQERDHAFIAVEVDGRIVAGCVASRSAAVVGISNLFGPEGWRRGALPPSRTSHPACPWWAMSRGRLWRS